MFIHGSVDLFPAEYFAFSKFGQKHEEPRAFERSSSQAGNKNGKDKLFTGHCHLHMDSMTL